MSISVNEIRKDFPLLENRRVIYLDTAATSQKPTCVLEAEREFYEKYNANPLRGLYELGEAATENTKKPERRSGDLSTQKKQRRSSLSAMLRKA